MNELWLTYADENGALRRISVEAERFVVGRHSANDLSVASEKISREHLQIERRGDRFVATDLNSSNGTMLNGENLFEPTALRNGDRLNLGGGLEIEIETVLAASADDRARSAGSSGDAAARETVSTPSAHISPLARTSVSGESDGGIPMSFFYLAPLLGLGILLFLGAIVYVSSGANTGRGAAKENDIVVSRNADEAADEAETDETPRPKAEKTGAKIDDSSADSMSNENLNAKPNSSLEPDAAPTPSAKGVPETIKIEQNAAQFLRRIAQNDPKAFVTSEQAQIVNRKIKQIGNSAALADNIKSAKASAAQIKTLAAAKNLKPQFLAAAALTKLGSNRGSVLQTAQTMSEILTKLGTQIGSELAADSLLVVAAYDQGEANDFLKMRNSLQQLSNQFPESSRTIRSIWFLHKNGKISDAQFDFAVRFLAIGAITQNPKDFGVNAEELKLD